MPLTWMKRKTNEKEEEGVGGNKVAREMTGLPIGDAFSLLFFPLPGDYFLSAHKLAL